MVFELLCCLFDIGLMLIFFHAFQSKREDKIPFWIFVCCFVLAEGILLAVALLFGNTRTEYRITVTVTISFLSFLGLTFLYAGPIRHRLFLAILYQVLTGLSELILTELIFLLPGNINEIIYESDVYASVFSKFILFFLIVVFSLLFYRKRRSRPIQYTLLLLIMPVISIFLIMANAYSLLQSQTATILSIAGAMGILFANLINYYLLQSVLSLDELKREKELSDHQLTFQAEKYKQLSSAYQKNRKMIHDTKNHFFFIRDCLNKGNTENLPEYLDKVIENIDSSYHLINTGNLVIDAFVSNHITLAKQMNIRYYTDIKIQKDFIQISDYDLCIILGNLLDNSLHAVSSLPVSLNPHIKVVLFTTKYEFAIHISNSIMPNASEQKITEANTGLYHGYGLVNVEEITLKNLGNYGHFIENGEYHAVVTIPYIQEKEMVV